MKDNCGIETTDTPDIPSSSPVLTSIQKKERYIVWHGTQCCVHAGMGEMAALQWHHPQSHSTFWTPHTVPTFGNTCHHHQTDRAHNNTLAMIHTWLSLKDEGWVDGLTLTTVDETPHHTHFHTIHQSKPTIFLSLLTLTQHALAWGHSAIVLPHLTLWRLCGCYTVSWHSDRSAQKDCKLNSTSMKPYHIGTNVFRYFMHGTLPSSLLNYASPYIKLKCKKVNYPFRRHCLCPTLRP